MGLQSQVGVRPQTWDGYPEQDPSQASTPQAADNPVAKMVAFYHEDFDLPLKVGVLLSSEKTHKGGSLRSCGPSL